MKQINTFEELYSFMKDVINGAFYDREMKVFDFNCDCYGNGMSTDAITTSHTKDGISIDIQERGINNIVLAFWDTKHTENDQCFGIEQLKALKHQVGDYEEYEPSPEELDAQLESLEEACRNPYADMYKNYIHESDVTPAYCNIISAMVCYMNGEFTREMLIKDISKSTDNNKDVIEHLETILPIREY